jgi:glutaredoxin-like protein NrdH
MEIIELFSKNDCQQCRMTEAWLKQRGVKYRKFMVDEQPGALARVKEMGYLAAPVVVTPDGESWSGFDPGRLNGLLR